MKLIRVNLLRQIMKLTSSLSKLLAVFMLLTISAAHAQICPPRESILSKGKPITYKVENEALIRVDADKGTETVVKDIGKVVTASHSVLNCNKKDEVQAEPNLLAVSKEDGTVWVRGLIWRYKNNAENLPIEKIFDSRKKWQQLKDFPPVKKVVVGETWVIGLHWDGTGSVWGANVNGVEIGTDDERKKSLPLINRTNSILFRFPSVIDVIAFSGAVYGLHDDGSVVAIGSGYQCHLRSQSEEFLQSKACPFISPSKEDGGVFKLWQTQGKPNECNVKFVKGQHWIWPCDDSNYGKSSSNVEPARPNRIEKISSLRTQ